MLDFLAAPVPVWVFVLALVFLGWHIGSYLKVINGNLGLIIVQLNALNEKLEAAADQQHDDLDRLYRELQTIKIEVSESDDRKHRREVELELAEFGRP